VCRFEVDDIKNEHSVLRVVCVTERKKLERSVLSKNYYKFISFFLHFLILNIKFVSDILTTNSSNVKLEFKKKKTF